MPRSLALPSAVKIALLVVVLSGCLVPGLFANLQVSFFTDPPDDHKVDKNPNAISGDGSVVVGDAYGGRNYESRPFFWSRKTGFLYLASAGHAVSVSADGKKIVGYFEGPRQSRIPVHWTVQGKKVTQALIPSDEFPYNKNILPLNADYPSGSADLSVLNWNTTNTAHVTRNAWISTEGRLQKFGPFFGEFATVVQAVSLDGRHFAGVDGVPAIGDLKVNGSAFVASQAGPALKLGPLPGDKASYATGISSDGAVAVGISLSTSGMPRPFRWTSSGGMAALPSAFPEIDTTSQGVSVSADGGRVAGYVISNIFDSFNFVWTPEEGTQSLETLLTTNGIELPYNDSYRVIAVSADGSTLLCRIVFSDAFHNSWQGFVISGFPKRGSFEFTSPTINIRGPKEILAGASAVTVRGSAADAHLAEVSYRIGKGAWRTFSHQRSWTAKIRGLRLGKNTVSFRARDKTGNSTIQSVTVERK